APHPATPGLATVDGGAVCARVGDDTGVHDVRVGATPPDLAAAARTPTGRGGVRADQVVVEPGRGAVVESAAAPGASGGAVSVVTDLGRRYVLADGAVLGMLGYSGVRPVRLPASLVSLVPAGSPLDPAAARAVAAPA
ncbi:type VII secretion protein EccB, partial [Micromonospora sicca]